MHPCHDSSACLTAGGVRYAELAEKILDGSATAAETAEAEQLGQQLTSPGPGSTSSYEHPRHSPGTKPLPPGYEDSLVSSSGFGSLAAGLAEARREGEAAVEEGEIDMDAVMGEADAALRAALQAQGLVVGGADTQERLADFVQDSLRTTQRFREAHLEEVEPSPQPRRGITADQISRAVEAGAATASGDVALGGRQIGPSGGRVLVAAVVRHRLRVRGLLLQDNMLGDTGAEALAAVLSVCALQTLDLSWNRIGRRGVQALSSSLVNPRASPRSSTGLQTLCLRGNRITDAGVLQVRA